MRYLYYTLYRHMANIKTNDTPAFNAMICISLLEIANFLTIVLLLIPKWKFQFQSRSDVVIDATIIALASFTMNYFYLIKKLPNLKSKYNKETNRRKLMGTILLITYIIASALSIYFVSTLNISFQLTYINLLSHS
jgi:hypothetical protein